MASVLPKLFSTFVRPNLATYIFQILEGHSSGFQNLDSPLEFHKLQSVNMFRNLNGNLEQCKGLLKWGTYHS